MHWCSWYDRRQVFPVTQHSPAVISVCLFRLEVQLEAIDICLDIGFLISRIGIGSENAGIYPIQLPQNLFHINGIDFLALYGFRCADMHHIDAVCHTVYAGAFTTFTGTFVLPTWSVRFATPNQLSSKRNFGR